MSAASDPVDYLSLDDLLEIAAGISDSVAVRDIGLLDSAAARPRTTVFGADAYADFSEKAAALMHSLARNHALIDGNKRLAWAATRAFCLLNGNDLVFSVDDAESMVLSVAAGHLDVPDLAALLNDHLTGSG
ncbi:MAG: type II toxin-antitoxin system death-on-curing family toxin [Actinomycetota bacterium]|nr:type II toxin-antitoxin system death-on-curing family toxin [Actinomycetota bacterium]